MRAGRGSALQLLRAVSAVVRSNTLTHRADHLLIATRAAHRRLPQGDNLTRPHVPLASLRRAREEGKKRLI
ncbi:hypothetical protein E2C01_091529 [Portunus trituberculatus]|uniref:Uncharacterized protein n=1 Tax=Portunus trituberculatus TaxID=210409 RepID=A0A5B7JN64_PORTR|nr:hypothetical protein [Portunus trituberculatus]